MTLLSDAELLAYIREDLPYFDLTTHLLDAPPQKARLSVMTRQEIFVACSEEAARVAELLGCEVQNYLPSKSVAAPGDTLLSFTGSNEALHQAWRLCQILLEYACGLATYSHTMVQNAGAVNPHCEILVTRKSFPFAKRFVIRALLCGGIMPHRLGLSETVLVFAQHRAQFADEAAFEAGLRRLKKRCVEKKLVVESESLEDAKGMFELGADTVQMDKCTPGMLEELVTFKRERFPGATILAAGGINKTNVAEFAATGVEGIVTSAPYQAGMVDLTSRWGEA